MSVSQENRIKARPNAQRNLGSNTTGLRRTGIETERDGLLYVPESFDPKSPTPLLILLHGPGGSAQQPIKAFRNLADRAGIILLAPESQGKTWDPQVAGFESDLYFIDEALGDVFALYPIDPKRIAIAGFSDGARFALSTGIQNSDVFTHVMVLSSDIEIPPEAQGSPHVFTPKPGSKTATEDICEEAFRWFLGDWQRSSQGETHKSAAKPN